MESLRRVLVIGLFSFTTCSNLLLSQSSLPLEQIQLPPGFRISLYARAAGARSMTRGPEGTLFVGTRRQGTVYAIRPASNLESGGEALILAEGLDTPNGVAFQKGSLFVAEQNRILRYDNIEARLEPT